MEKNSQDIVFTSFCVKFDCVKSQRRKFLSRLLIRFFGEGTAHGPFPAGKLQSDQGLDQVLGLILHEHQSLLYALQTFEAVGDQLLRVDIAEVLNCREICYAGIEAKVFLCRAQVEERNWLFELKYTIRSHRWQFMRMVYG